ncbi:MAG: pyridoxamine 5'-phosphate oxidase family protein [Deltaproteobacteria bacterium]|nr:pyridoxamine 5'-phosphate oxidase family protein [Deltaproteobacteria bacterium]
MEKIESIILKAKVCRLGLVDGNRPYVVPMSFGYHENALYFHTGKKGRKMEILERNNRVCFEMEVDLEIVPADNPCKWNMRYRSVVGYGRAVILVDPGEKIKALDVIVRHYGGPLMAYDEKRVKGLAIIKVAIDSMKGKQSKV